MAGLTPETSVTLATVGALTAVYVALHRSYFLGAFPRHVLAHLDPRLLLTWPRTPWGLVCKWHLERHPGGTPPRPHLIGPARLHLDR